MPANPRRLRARADSLDTAPPPRTKRQQQCYDRIMAIAPTLLAEFGPSNITIASLALALRITPAALRHLFVDIDDLLGAILLNHLENLAETIAAIPEAAPNARQARRAAYIAATRGTPGCLTIPHYLLVHTRHILPEDLLDRIDAHRAALAEALAGDMAASILFLLDDPSFDPATIETMLGAAIQSGPVAAKLALARNTSVPHHTLTAADPAEPQQTRAPPPVWRPPPQHSPPPP